MGQSPHELWNSASWLPAMPPQFSPLAAPQPSLPLLLQCSLRSVGWARRWVPMPWHPRLSTVHSHELSYIPVVSFFCSTCSNCATRSKRRLSRVSTAACADAFAASTTSTRADATDVKWSWEDKFLAGALAGKKKPLEHQPVVWVMMHHEHSWCIMSTHDASWGFRVWGLGFRVWGLGFGVWV